jgi:hypothetical protein
VSVILQPDAAGDDGTFPRKGLSDRLISSTFRCLP